MKRTLSVVWAAAIAGAVVAWSQGCLRKPPEVEAVQQQQAPSGAMMPATKSGFVPSPPDPPAPEPAPEPEQEQEQEPKQEPKPEPER